MQSLSAAIPRLPIVILGCTASGKSDLAESLAMRINAEILVVDSMQVYRGMDVGTAKPDAATRIRIAHHMLDVADPWEAYSAARFVADARHLLETHFKIPSLAGSPDSRAQPLPGTPNVILVAGTFLYLRSLIEGLFEGPCADQVIRAELNDRAARHGANELHAELAAVDPISAQRIHANDQRRIIRALEVYRITGTAISTLQTQWSQAHPRMNATYIGIRWEKDALSRRINARVKNMIAGGLVEEVDRLRRTERGFSEEAAAAVGYRELLDYFDGRAQEGERRPTLEDAIEQIKIHTRALAKMQRTWLKKWPPPPAVHWIDVDEGTNSANILNEALRILSAT